MLAFSTEFETVKFTTEKQIYAGSVTQMSMAWVPTVLIVKIPTPRI